RGVMETIISDLDLESVLDKQIAVLSGGELQRFCIALVAVQSADVYMIDEPSSYLDIKQRIKAARVVRQLLTDSNYVLCVEHDLSILDYLSDFICVLYGQQGCYETAKVEDQHKGAVAIAHYPEMTKSLGSFQLKCEAGQFSNSEIIVMLGENGTGKTTLVNMLAGLLPPDGQVEVPQLNISYKPQKISPKPDKTGQ
ncbi:MAG: putative ATP-binding cassette sub-family E member 1, partial [Streblomastix strix]